jgi:hypothetical protein
MSDGSKISEGWPGENKPSEPETESAKLEAAKTALKDPETWIKAILSVMVFVAILVAVFVISPILAGVWFRMFLFWAGIHT